MGKIEKFPDGGKDGKENQENIRQKALKELEGLIASVPEGELEDFLEKIKKYRELRPE